MSQPEWLSGAETVTFFGLIISFIGLALSVVHNRMASWKGFEKRTIELELIFKQYQTDTTAFRQQWHDDVVLYLETTNKTFADYLKTCESCRADVRLHHERDDRHVTSDLRAQISALVSDMADVKRFLMTEVRRG